MTYLQAAILGVVQGVTEFLPVSSDGHLALVYATFGAEPSLAFEVFLHLATLVAMLVYFRADVLRLARALLPAGRGTGERRVAVLILGTNVVTGVLVLAIEPVVEPMAASLLWVGVWLLATSAVMALAEWRTRGTEPSRDAAGLGWGRALAIGVAQGAAALPGLSRSGSTISAGMLSGLSREQAARFSFLLGIPIIAVANLKSAYDLLTGSPAFPSAGVAAVGFVAALASGYAAIAWLLGLVRRHSLLGFSVYTALMGTASIVIYVLA